MNLVHTHRHCCWHYRNHYYKGERRSSATRVLGMGTASSPNRGRLSFATGGKEFDVEYQEHEISWPLTVSGWTPWLKNPLRVSRLQRASLCLLVIDIVIVIFVLRGFMPLITLLQRNEELFGAHLTLPVIDHPQTAGHHGEEHPIPRILHQTTATEKIPDKWAFSQHTCKEAYADYDYKVGAIVCACCFVWPIAIHKGYHSRAAGLSMRSARDAAP